MVTYNNICPNCNNVMSIPTWRICNSCDSRTRKRNRPEKPLIKKYYNLIPEPFISKMIEQYLKDIKMYKSGGYIDRDGFIRPRYDTK